MKERILEFLDMENKTSAQFAAEIGVQPSSISHIISGRNNPSLEFILKMLTRYPGLSSDWLLFGKGNPYRSSEKLEIAENELDLFGEQVKKTGDPVVNIEVEKLSGKGYREAEMPRAEAERGKYSGAVRIVCFYPDKTFKEYFPGNE